MYYRSSHRPLFTGHPPTSGPTTRPIFSHAPYTEIRSGDQASSPRQIAVPAPGLIPSFDDVFGLAVTSALFDQTVLVICTTEQVLTNWRRRLQERARPVAGLELLDGQFAWSANWRAFFCSRSYEITVLHGLRSAFQDQSLPLSYTRRLVDAVPAGLIVLA